MEVKILFEFNDTDKIKCGNNLHIKNSAYDVFDKTDWSVESILVAAEETIGTIPLGTHICKINGQYYQFEQVPYDKDGAETRNIKLLK